MFFTAETRRLHRPWIRTFQAWLPAQYVVLFAVLRNVGLGAWERSSRFAWLVKANVFVGDVHR